MKKNIKIEGKTIAAFILITVVFTAGIFMFSGQASALIQAVQEEAYDGGGGGGGSGSYDPDPTPTPTPTPSGWPSAGSSIQMSSCPNGLVVTRSAYCSGTTLVVEDYHSSWTSPAYEDCMDDGYGYTNCSWIDAVVHDAYTTSVGSVANSSECPVACTSAPNVCGQTNNGILVNGVCNASRPANPTPIPCTSAPNSCGETREGTKACVNSACSATPPPDPAPIACTSAANNCSQTNSGTKACPTSSCSATKPADKPLPACTSAPNNCGQTNTGVTQCDGSCNAPKVPDQTPIACVSAANICGQTNAGTKTCPTSACSAVKPADPAPLECESAANVCGMTNKGTKACPTSACSAVKPSDSLCICPGAIPPNHGDDCSSEANVCGYRNFGKIDCNGNCSAPKPANPTDLNRPCTSAANICGATASGTMICSGIGNGLVCSATTPVATPIPCTSSANACGQTNTGTKACPTSACSAGTPGMPAPTACTSAANACGQTNTGTKACPTSSCSASTPSVTPIPCTSAANSCGMTNSGTKNCASDACPATVPSESLCNCGGNPPANFGTACTTAANSCGQTITRTIGCDGTCGAAPLDSLCPIPCTSAPNSCGQTTAGVSISGVCNAVTPPNPSPIPCTTEANACGMTTSGTKMCALSSCLPKVPDSSCPPADCNSAPNACGETGAGKLIGGVCNAVIPPNPQIFIDTGSCIAPPVIEGTCNPTAVNGCLSGSIFSDRTDTGTDNLWTCRGLNGGKDAACSLPKAPAIKPTVSVNPPANNIKANESTSFTWSVTNATWCDRYKNGAFDGSVSTIGGTFNSLSLFSSTSYDIQCINENGSTPFPVTTGSHVASVSALPAPIITITPPTSNITSGQTTTFSWNVTNSTTCRLFKDGAFVEVVPPVRSFTSGALTSNTEYAISCVNEIGPGPYPTDAKQHNVFVTAVPPGPPVLTIVERPVQYNNISFGESHTQRLTIRNDGDSLLTGSVSISNNYTNVFKLQTTDNTFSLAEGSTKTFYVTFSPVREKSDGKVSFLKRLMASAGLAAIKSFSITSNAAIVITSNAGNQNVPIEGTGVEMVSGDTIMSVGDVPVGVSRTFTYPVRNNTLNQINACLKLTPSSTFLCGSSSKCSKIVNAGGQALFSIVFTPTSIKPGFNDTVTVGTEETDGSCKRIFDMEITGNGVKPVSTFIEK